ncbi:hypothetical protein [Phyllobacterium lublinensis]|uniref:hypothetical protein n=1 Tax=Phyllobacterium lublinensis TaxID=2875708 RepID=UPI001CCFFF90|nr:hypothetical protein [Phyllobacterium sp. 2063]MBZ9655086.1 hypothetical protein [Phyllobacterium sp. 2063]
MRLLLPVLALGAVILAGCANSGSVSPLVFCDRPSDFGAKVFTDCTPRVGGDSPARSARDSRRFSDDRRIILGGVYGR